jgi:DUF1365 family protein
MGLKENALYLGKVRHARYRPRTHRFTYRVFSAFLNVDDIDHNRLNLKLLSIDRFNLFSFRRRDHGAKTAGAEDGKLRPFIEELLAEAGLAAPEQIHILCYLRMFGFAFNPLTVYYCRSAGRLTAMVYEVRNTFGDDHIYVVPLNGANADRPLLHHRDKLMHVSPFIGMQATYHFSAAVPDDNLRLVIRETQDNQPLLIASFVGQRETLTDAALFKAFIKHPLMTVKVLVAIHFEAAKLFMKGVPFIKRPQPPQSRHSI